MFFIVYNFWRYNTSVKTAVMPSFINLLRCLETFFLLVLLFTSWVSMRRSHGTTENGAKDEADVTLELDPNVLDNRRKWGMRNKWIDADFPGLDNSVGVGRGLVSELEKQDIKNKLDDRRLSKSQNQENKSDKNKKLNVCSSKHKLSAVGRNKVFNLEIKGRLEWMTKAGQEICAGKVEDVRKGKDHEWR